MPKPLPIIRLSSFEQAANLAYGLYEIGMRFSAYDDPDEGVNRLISGTQAGDLMWAESLYRIDGAPAGDDETEWFDGRVLVNSARQFVAYVESLRREDKAVENDI